MYAANDASDASDVEHEYYTIDDEKTLAPPPKRMWLVRIECELVIWLDWKECSLVSLALLM